MNFVKSLPAGYLLLRPNFGNCSIMTASTASFGGACIIFIDKCIVICKFFLALTHCLTYQKPKNNHFHIDLHKKKYHDSRRKQQENADIPKTTEE